MTTTTRSGPAAAGVVWARHTTLEALWRGVAYALVAAVVCLGVVTTYGLAADSERSSPAPRAAVPTAATAAASAAVGGGHAAPSAAEFAAVLIGTTNAHAAASGDPTRIANPDCVQAAAGRYMCSFASVTPGGARTCHVMQARWTPQGASSFTVTLAGRALRCGSLREALRSLQ